MSAGVFFQPGVNYYVPKMQQSPGVGDDGLFSISLGVPTAAALNSVITTAAGAITNAAKVFNAANTSALPYTVDALYGRALQLTGGTAGDNAVLSIRGVDYLGQPIIENVTLNGTTTVQSNKAFRRVDSVSVPAGNANASSSIQLGLSARFGLPFKTLLILTESYDDTPQAVGTFVPPNLTDPQTAVTGDPRGLYTPTGTPNGARNFTITGRVSKITNASDNGGMHGLRQFFQ